MDCWANDVPILNVISACGISVFKKSGGEFGLLEGGEETDGRAGNTEKNIITDFTGKGRAEGGPFAFVRALLSLSDSDTYLRFEDKFISYKPNTATPLQIWNGLKELGDNQNGYLAQRGIDFNLVKNFVKLYNGGIACLIYQKGIPCGINCRSLESDHKKRFFSYPGFSTAGIYQSGLDEKKDYLIVVEGLIDFLTLKQYETNVVGLKSAESGIEEIIKLSRDYNIIFVFDNDESGRNTRDRISSIKYKYFNRSVVTVKAKDVNDIHEYIGELIIEYIKNNLLSDTPIFKTIEKYKERQRKLRNNGGILGIPGPFDFYKKTSGVVEGKVYTIGAFSNTGKSKLAYCHASRFLKQGHRVLFVSVEESEEDMFGNIMSAYTGVPLYQLGDHIIEEKNYENLVLSDSAKTTTQIDDLVKAHNPRIVVIDYAQGLQAKGGTIYEKQANIALGIQQIAIQNKCTVFSLSQLSNETIKDIQTKGLANIDIVSLKGAGEYYAGSDVIFVLARENGKMNLQINKNKLGRRGTLYEGAVTRESNQFEFNETQEQNPF